MKEEMLLSNRVKGFLEEQSGDQLCDTTHRGLKEVVRKQLLLLGKSPFSGHAWESLEEKETGETS